MNEKNTLDKQNQHTEEALPHLHWYRGVMLILEFDLVYNSVIIMPVTMTFYQNLERLAP